MTFSDSKKRVTLLDVARVSGVSKGTVDRALHNREGINPVVKLKIIDTARQLNYKPNRIARSLSIKKTTTIGLIYPQEPSFYWEKIRKGFDAAASELEEFGLETIHGRFESLFDDCEAGIIRNIDLLIKGDVSAVVVVPYDTEPVQNKIAELNAAGIPVITLSTDISNAGERIFFLGADNYQIGRAAAGLIGKFLRGQGDLLVVSMPLDTVSYHFRFRGFQEVIKQDYPDIRIVSHYRSNKYLELHDRLNLKDIIFSHKLDGVYVMTSDPILGQVAAIVEETVEPDRLVLVGHEVNDNIHHLLQRNIITAVICQHPFSQGYQTLKMLYQYIFDRKKPKSKVLKARIDIFTKENSMSYDQGTDLY